MRVWVTILAIWCAGLGAAAQFGKMSILYPDLAQYYAGAGALGLGLLVSITGMLGLVLGTTAGLLVMRIGLRRSMLAALLLGAAVSLVQALLPPFPVMMLTRLLEGLSHLVIVVVAPTAIAGVAPLRLQGAAMTLWSSFFGLTYALLALVAPSLMAAGGAPLLFNAHAGWMVAFAGVLALLMPPDRISAQTGPRIGLLAQHLRIYRSPFVGAPATGFMFYTVTYVALLTLLPTAATPGWSGFLALWMPLTSVAVSLTLGVWLLTRVGAVRLVQVGYGVALVAAVGLWLFWGRGLGEAVAALILSGALGIVQGASFAALAALNPAAQDRGAGSGAIVQLGNLGTTVGMPLMALILTGAGATGLMVFLVGCFAMGIGVHAVQARRRAVING